MKLTANKMAIAQGLFYLGTGLWPLFSMRTFEKVTGPKTDDWLVKTVGLLIATSGAVFLRSGWRGKVPQEVSLLAAGQALTLGGISLFYSSRGRISKIYLLDTAVEGALIALWRKAA